MRGFVEKRDLEKETDNAVATISEKTIVLLDSDRETDEQSTLQSMKVAFGIASGTPIVPDPPENSTPPLAGTDSIMRKLFRTPPSATRNAERRRSGDGTDSSMRSGSSRKKSAQLTSKKMRFKITPAMDFNNRQSALFAYVFDGNLDPCEELVRIGVKSADRVDLHSLLPGNDVDDKIIHMVVMTMTGVEILATSPAYWCLPPSDDILNGETTELMLNRYTENWMRPSRFLELIYVPMQDVLGHWILMLVSLKDRAIYNLDSSPNQFKTPHREDRIRKMARVLYNVTQAVYEKHLMPLPSNFGDFPIRSPIGIPNCGQRGTINPIVHRFAVTGERDQGNNCGEPDQHTIQQTLGPCIGQGRVMEDENKEEHLSRPPGTALDTWFNQL
ncbi:hypothetical protein HN873_008005 [Arachis hypogaea]